MLLIYLTKTGSVIDLVEETQTEKRKNRKQPDSIKDKNRKSKFVLYYFNY